MKIEPRYTIDNDGNQVTRGLVLVSESEEESLIIDEVFGKSVDANGICGTSKTATAKLSDGYLDHYIYIEV